jgi:membrane protein involved in colicin uptake
LTYTPFLYKTNLNLTLFTGLRLFVFIVLFCFAGTLLHAQSGKLEISGILALDNAKPNGASVLIEKGGKSSGSVPVTPSGAFEVLLDFNSEYILTFSQPGYTSRKIKVLSTVPEDSKKDGGMEFSTQILIHQPIPGVSGNDIYATLKFNNSSYDLEFDKPEMISIAEQKKVLEPLKADAQRRAAEDAKAKADAIAKRYAEEEAARKKAVAEEELNRKYQELIGPADKAFEMKDYPFAKEKYTEAAALKPAEIHPKTRLAEIEKFLTAAAKEKELAEKYAAAMAAADKALNLKDYTNAKAKYTEASVLKPSEPAPKDKIKEVDALLLAAQKEKELKAKYDAAVAAADKAFTAKDYTTAKTKYTEASTLKPDETHPKNRLAEVDKFMADEAERKKKEKELNDAYVASLNNANTLFQQKRYEEAKTAYTEASGLKPAEVLPKTKIKEIETLLANEAARLAKEKETIEKYNKAIEDGDAAFASSDYTKAKTFFTAATVLKPSEAYPKEKIKEIDTRLAAEQKLKDLESKYTAALARANKLFAEKNYVGAKAAYSEALTFKPSESAPAAKVKECEELIAKQSADKILNDRYIAALAKGDQLLKSLDFNGAIASYSDAQNLKPDEQTPKEKIEQAKNAMAAAEAAKQKAAEDAAAKKIEAERLAEEARKKAEEVAKKKAEEDAAKKAAEEQRQIEELKKRQEAEAARLAEEARKKKEEEEKLRIAAEAARIKAEEDAKKKAEEAAKQAEVARLKAEEDAKKKADEDAKKAAELAKQQEAARLKAEEDAKKKAEEDAKKAAELAKQQEAARLKAEEDARKKAEEDAKKAAELAKQQEAARLKAEEEAKKKAEEDARVAAEEAARKAEEDKKNAEILAKQKAEQMAKAAADAAERKKQQAEYAKKAAEESARRKAEFEAKRAMLEIERKEREKRLKEEQERIRNMPYIVLRKFTTSTSQLYGYINLGNGTGLKDVSEAEYKMYAEKYKGIFRYN